VTTLLHKELTGTVIGVYYDVYNNTSHTYPEYIYERAMVHDLRNLGITCQRQTVYEVWYKDKKVGEQHLDMFLADEVVVELKVASELTRLNKAQAMSYLKVTNKQVGLLFNFGGSQPQFRRLYFEVREPSSNEQAVHQAVANMPDGYLDPELTWEIIGGLLEVHSTLGPGFIYRIYANACFHELQLRGLDVKAEREFQVIYKGEAIGTIKFTHLRVEDKVMVFPVAVTDVNDIRLNNLKDWMHIESVPLGILANYYEESLKPIVLRV
jgi:GxxExxY protein